METSTLSATLILMGAIGSSVLQSQKIAILENPRKKPSTGMNNLISSGLNFTNLVMFLGVLLLAFQRVIPKEFFRYEHYITTVIGLIYVLIGGSVLVHRNLPGKVSSLELVAVGLILSGYSIKHIIENHD